MQKYFKFFYLIKILKQYKNNHRKKQTSIKWGFIPKDNKLSSDVCWLYYNKFL